MKKVISILLFLLGAISLTGCSASRSTEKNTITSQTSNTSLDNTTFSVNYEDFHADYPHYGTIDEMKEKANLVFVGTVRSITFELLDMYTMKPIDNLDSAGFPLINTIYEVEVNHAYSDMSDTIVKVRIEGGMREQMLDEQVAIAKSNTIVVQDDAPSLTSGESYLFAVYLADNANYASIVNPFQSIYSLENIDAKSDVQVFSAADIMSSYSDNAVWEFQNQKGEWMK